LANEATELKDLTPDEYTVSLVPIDPPDDSECVYVPEESFEQTVTVPIGDEGTVTFKLNCDPNLLSVTPDSAISFEHVLGQPECVQSIGTPLTLMNLTDVSLSWVASESGPGFSHVDAEPRTGDLAPGASVVVNLTYTCDSHDRSYENGMNFSYTTGVGGVQGEIEIPITATIDDTPGTLTVTTVTTGAHLPDHYDVEDVEDGVVIGTIGPNETKNILGVRPGEYQIRMQPKREGADADNCTFSNSFVRDVRVPAGATGTASFAAECVGGNVFAYVANSGSDNVTVIDVTTNTIVEHISVGSSPDGIAISPDHHFVYVTNIVSDELSVIDVDTNVATTTTSTFLGQESGAGDIAISPNSDFAYVPRSGFDDVLVIDLADPVSVETTISLGDGSSPSAITIDPDLGQAFVTLESIDGVSVISLASNSGTDLLEVGSGPVAIAITPDGTLAYVVGRIIESVVPILLSNGSALPSLDVGTNPLAIVITPDGNFAYVANAGSDNVSVINLTTSTITSIPVGSKPTDIALSPDGLFAYVTNLDSNDVSVIRLADNTVIDTITVGTAPTAIVIMGPSG